MVGALTGLITGLMGIGSQVGNFFLNQAQMEKQNRYNSPAAQMHRLRVAGINPYAAISQVAGQNQGQMATSDFDFGQSLGQAVNAYSNVENVEMNKALNDKRIEKMQEEIKGLFLDNYFSGMTMQDRIKEVGFKAIESMYDADSAMSIADLNWLKSQWERYIAGVDQNTFTDESLKSRDYLNDLRLSDVAADIAEDTQVAKVNYELLKTKRMQIAKDIDEATKQFKINYENFKTLKTEKDYQIAIERLAREKVARIYEETANMPWASKDLVSHYVVKVIELIKNYPKGKKAKPKDILQYVWDNL